MLSLVHKRCLFSIVFLFLVGCLPNESTALQLTPTKEATATITGQLFPTSTPTTSRATLAPTTTATFIVTSAPYTTTNLNSKQYMITVETSIPFNSGLKGVLSISPQSYLSDASSLLNLEDLEITTLPIQKGGKARIEQWGTKVITNDCTHLAYMERGQPGDILHIITANGRDLPIINWPETQFWEIIGWVDLQRLLLSDLSYSDGSLMVYAPFEGHWEMLPLPVAFSTESGNVQNVYYDSPPYGYFDPDLTRVIIKRRKESAIQTTYELWNVETKEILWEKQTAGFYNSVPSWSSSGDHFAVILDHFSIEQTHLRTDPGLSSLFIVGRDGTEIMIIGDLAGELAWSPNDRYIAAWLPGEVHHGEKSYWGSSLTVIDVTSGDISVYSFLTEGANSISQFPVWSPDSRYVAFTNTFEVDIEEVDRTIILDIIEKRAFEVIRNYQVRNWMKAEP